MQYKLTYPDGYVQEVEAEACEKFGDGVVFVGANRTSLLAVDSRVEITDADGHAVTPTAVG